MKVPVSTQYHHQTTFPEIAIQSTAFAMINMTNDNILLRIVKLALVPVPP